jgi:chromosome condensin MukBEF complex kleisin-like MukF subunit
MPWGANLCRKLSERYQLAVPPVDGLRSDGELAPAELQDRFSHIEELHDVSDDPAELAFLAELKTLIEARLAGHSQ